MDRIILIAVAMILSVFSYSLWDKNKDLETNIEREIKKNQISIDQSMLSKATEFTFMKITNHFTYLMSEDDIGPKKGKWEALYQWEYTFNFGYKIKDKWNWCIQIDQDEGTVTINAPKVVQLNKSDASPRAKRIFNGGFKVTQIAAQDWMVNLANETMIDTANAYLNNPTVQDSVRKSLASFFQDILNDAHESSNPITKVIVNSVNKDKCDK